MVIRPLDASGDIQPVRSLSDLSSGADAVAALAAHRLKLLAGEWWEHPGWGCAILNLLRNSRLTEADQSAVSAYLLSFVRQTPGVASVEEASASVRGRVLTWRCRLLAEGGKTASVDFSLDF